MQPLRPVGGVRGVRHRRRLRRVRGGVSARQRGVVSARRRLRRRVPERRKPALLRQRDLLPGQPGRSVAVPPRPVPGVRQRHALQLRHGGGRSALENKNIYLNHAKNDFVNGNEKHSF